MRGNPYSLDEELFLIENSHMPINEIAGRINRSYHSVAVKISKLKCGKFTKHDESFNKELISCEDVDHVIAFSEKFNLKISTVMQYRQEIGLPAIRIYTIWKTLIQRCTCKTNKDYNRYGARSITVCDEWKNDFISFYMWTKNNNYSKDLTIDRIDVNGNYCPENCRWATYTEQANNRRNTLFLTAFNETKTLKEWSKDPRCNVRYETLRERVISNKLNPEEILSNPSKIKKRLGVK